MKPKSQKTKFFFIFKIGLTAGLLIYILSGCALFGPPNCGLDCEARHVCNGLNDLFYENKASFETARLSTNSKLARLYCEHQVGLVLPPDIEEIKKNRAKQNGGMMNKQAVNTTQQHK
jgi:hypothetical protein